MNERTCYPRELEGGPGSLGDLFDPQDGSDGLVTVSSGPHKESLPLRNMSVGEIRRRFRDRFDLDPESQAVIDGYEVGDNAVVRAGQFLTFTRHAGEKGRRDHATDLA